MGKIYILGGLLRTCIVFDPMTSSFEEIEMMMEVRDDAACAVFGGRIFISGGVKYNKQRVLYNPQSLKTVEAYDHCLNKWSQIPDMIQGRHNHSLISIENRLYVVGGSSNQCEVFNGFSQTFTSIKSTSSIYNMYYFSSNYRYIYAATGDKIEHYRGSLLTAAVYDAEKEKWSEINYIDLGTETSRLFFC